LEISRDGHEKFIVIVKFRNIAIKNSEDPEKKKKKQTISFRCKIQALTAENLIFSIPHRLVVTALRRKAARVKGSVRG